MIQRFVTKANAPKSTTNPAAQATPYLNTLPLWDRQIGALPLPPHSGHTPVAEQCGHVGSDEFKCGFVPVPWHSSHLPEPSQNVQLPETSGIERPQVLAKHQRYRIADVNRRFRSLRGFERNGDLTPLEAALLLRPLTISRYRLGLVELRLTMRRVGPTMSSKFWTQHASPYRASPSTVASMASFVPIRASAA